MTLRARPVARRRGRAGWDSGDRRNNLINLGFVLAIVVSVLILVGYGAYSWYDDHFGAAATVNGVVITKDQLRSRLKVEDFGLNYIESRIDTLIAEGKLDAGDGEQQKAIIQQRRDQLASLTLERLVDVELMGELAATQGIDVTEAEIDNELVARATTPEQRHVWMIEVEPATDAITGEVTEEAKRNALGDAQRALTRLKHGESWDDVAKTASDSALAPQAGDLGWLSKDSGYDPAFMTAVYAADLNQPTDIVEGDDGVFRIGRFTETTPEFIDPNFEASIETAGITLTDYRVAVRGDVMRRKLSEQVVADLSAPSLQRHVVEIYLPTPNASSVGLPDGVKVRHILFAPNNNADKAADLPAEDPAWAKAKAEADAAYAELKLHPEKFDEMARTVSDERSAKLTGGKQPWYYPGSTVDQDFKNAILAPDLTPGQLLAPVKTAFGWHVIQFMRPTGDGDPAWLNVLKGKATTEAIFRQLAKDNSEGPEAKDGGDLGWIAHQQLTDKLDTAVFSTVVGSISGVITIADGGSSDGSYLLMVLAEETKAPTKDQLKLFNDTGFSTWYTAQKEAAKIDYNIGSSSGTA